MTVIYLYSEDEGKTTQILTSEPTNQDNIIESFVADDGILESLDKINEGVKIGKTLSAKATLFCRWCQRFQHYSDFPFENLFNGIADYLTHDLEKNQDYPMLHELENFKNIKHYKHVEMMYHENKLLHPYETFAGEWLWERNVRGNSSYLPYEVLTSLKHSHITTMTHLFADKFRPYQEYHPQFVYELTHQWLTSSDENKNEVNMKDINGLLPIDVFKWHVWADDESDPWIVKMLELLKPTI